MRYLLDRTLHARNAETRFATARTAASGRYLRNYDSGCGRDLTEWLSPPHRILPSGGDRASCDSSPTKPTRRTPPRFSEA